MKKGDIAMIIGVTKEIKNNESRVGLTPAGVHAFVESGHTVKVEKNAGAGSYFYDSDYVDAGAEIAETAAAAWDADMVVDRKSTRLNSSHVAISYAVFCLNKKSDQRGDHG